MALPILDDKQFTRGGFQAIKKVCGILTDMSIVESKNPNSEYEKLVEIVLEDAQILEMDEGEPQPELSDGIFRHKYPYLKAGKVKPYQNSPYAKGFWQSGKDVGIFPDSWQGAFVTLEKKSIVLFQRSTGDTDEEGNKVMEEIVFNDYLCFVPNDDEAGQESIEEYTIAKLTGLAPTSAVRTAVLDARIKNNKDIVAAIRAQNFSGIGLEIVEGRLVPIIK